jgi:hypothetical protein
MTSGLRTVLAIAIGVAGAAVLWIAASHSSMPVLLGGSPQERAPHGEQRRGAERPGSGGGAASDRRQDGRREGRGGGGRTDESLWSAAGKRLESGLGMAWRATRLALAVAALGLVLLLLARRRSRRRRKYVRLWLLPYRADETQPDEIVRLFEIWQQQLLERWWRRPVMGQPGIALELVMGPDAEGDAHSRLAIVCPEHFRQAVEGALLGCYPDCRLLSDPVPLPEVDSLVRLKKRYSLVRALRTVDELVRRPVDSALSNMESLNRPAVVQLVLTPTPAVFDHYARWRYGSEERSSERASVVDEGDPGLQSEVLEQELKGGLRVQHHALFFTEIRIAATSHNDCMAIAGVMRGESSAENRLVVRRMRLRLPLYLRRLRAGIGNPLPSWRRGVLSSAELAGVWHLPSPGLKLARMERSPVPRIPAPPEISRRKEHALMRDEHGVIGIRPEDKTDGLGLIGGQKTGKTSVLCRTVRADAHDRECAVIVLMPKPGDALKALSMVPKKRTVHYLDLERPELGINPLAAPGDAAMVADKIVEAFRDVNMDGDIRGSSDRYLRQAAQAAIGASRTGIVEGPPTLWHMYRILMPDERAFRERVVDALSLDTRYVDTATFFGRELPTDLEASPSQTAAKLDAPRNKILRLLVESLDKVLRHPIQLDLDEVVRRREVLVVDGKMGTFGADNCRVMMQFILSALYGALRRQQELDESERVRVALKVDEAHLILNESFADAMATLRSGGLEVVAAWQYGEQIQDRKIRGGMMSLLRQRCMFSMGETEDAREMSNLAMAVYSDMIRDTPESRARMRVTPDTIFNLPNYHAICSWINRGARVPAFLGRSIPLDHDEDVVLHHVEAQRERGYHVPEGLPDPLPDLDWKGHRELPSELLADPGVGSENGAKGSKTGAQRELPDRPVTSEEGDREAATAAAVALEFDPAATSVDDSAAPSLPRRPADLPDTYNELDLEGVRGLTWDKVTPIPADRRHEPTGRELAILAALWSYRFLFATQIRRRWWRGSSLRAAQQTLNKMAKAGWVRRFRFQLSERGAQQRVYCITRQGFELAQQRTGRKGPYVDPGAKWREPVVSDARRILRSLHVNGWTLGFNARIGKAFRGWRGPREAHLKPPSRRVRGQWVELTPREIVVGASHKLRDYEPHKFEPVSPDATVEVELEMGEARLRFDLLVEVHGARSAAASEERLRRYDGLISGWSGTLDRYKTLGTPPVVVFVCADERAAAKLVEIADRVVTARLAKPGTEQTEWPHPGRRGMFFAAEHDIHLGSLQALQVPELPPDLRGSLHGRRARTCHPRRVNMIEPRLLDVA